MDINQDGREEVVCRTTMGSRVMYSLLHLLALVFFPASLVSAFRQSRPDPVLTGSLYEADYPACGRCPSGRPFSL